MLGGQKTHKKQQTNIYTIINKTVNIVLLWIKKTGENYLLARLSLPVNSWDYTIPKKYF